MESLSRPGGNVTGIQNGDTIPKGLEWLHKIVPQATQVHVIYHHQDQVAHTAIQPLPAIASSLGVALVLDEVRSLEEARAAIATMPKEAAIFLVPTPSLEPSVSALIEVAMHRGIASRPTDRVSGVFLTPQLANSHRHWPRHPGRVPPPGRYGHALISPPCRPARDALLRHHPPGLVHAESSGRCVVVFVSA